MARRKPTPTADPGYLAALVEERRGYALHGRHDRVADVDAELARCGAAAPEAAVTRAHEKAVAPKAKRAKRVRKANKSAA